MTVLLPVDAPVIITKHADRRLHERFGIDDLDMIRDEITEAIEARHYAHRARRYFYVYAATRWYPVAWSDRKVIVLTVCEQREDLAS